MTAAKNILTRPRLPAAHIVVFSFSIFASVSFGGSAASALYGAASVIGSIAPTVTSGIQASADMHNADVAARTAEMQTRVAMETTKYLSTAQTFTTLAQTMATLNINRINQQGETDRLAMQLGVLRENREAQFKLEREKLALEWELNRAKIDLAMRQSQANYQLARMQLQMEMVKAGLSTGFVTKNSGSGLTVSSVLMGQNSKVILANTTAPRAAPWTERLPSSAYGPSASRARGPLGVRDGGTVAQQLSLNALARGSRPGSLIRRSPTALGLSDLSRFEPSLWPGLVEPRHSRMDVGPRGGHTLDAAIARGSHHRPTVE